MLIEASADWLQGALTAALPGMPLLAPQGEATATSYAEARAIRESALAELAQLKLATERCKHFEVATVKRDWVSTLTSLRGRLLAIPARYRQRTGR